MLHTRYIYSARANNQTASADTPSPHRTSTPASLTRHLTLSSEPTHTLHTRLRLLKGRVR